MPNRFSRTYHLTSPDQTAMLGQDLAHTLAPGDVILLEGPVGAGKTLLARALIQAILREEEEVPSPTFTLVQTYEGQPGEIWHADLYRVTSTSELEELGLLEAFETAICLVEWPDRLGSVAPKDALTLQFQTNDHPTERQLQANWADEKWSQKAPKWTS